MNAVLYVMENGCKWRSLPKESVDWHVIYVRVNRWAKKGVLQAAFLRLQQLGVIQIKVNVISLDSTFIKIHPDGMGALKKAVSSPSGKHGMEGIIQTAQSGRKAFSLHETFSPYFHTL